MSTFAVRLYRGLELDAAPVMAFLSEISLHPGFTTDFHIGDFIWAGFAGLPKVTGDRLSIWERHPGGIAGLGWFEAPHRTDLTVHPQLLGTNEGAELIREMVRWAEETHAGQDEAPPEPLSMTVPHYDTFTQEVVTELGYRFTGKTPYAGNFRMLEAPIEPAVLPDGFTIVAMTDAADLIDRVEIHRDVWAPSKFTMERYQWIRQAPVYRQDLDLVVRAPDGRFASYLIAWWDPRARSGLLEPVGARSEYRRSGLTRALIQEALHRLHALGATRVFVNSVFGESPANALYRSLGFRCVVEWKAWTKSDAESEPPK
jgi:GNAT superfamily N-acetyltransferase